MKNGQKSIKDRSIVTTQKVSVRKHIVRGEKKGNVIFDSTDYWEKRYVSGGNSGMGSYGILSDYKKTYINKFILDNKIRSLIEYGCGDCNQLIGINCKEITGLDVSKRSIELCKKKFPNYDFVCLKEHKFPNKKVDLILSLDVIYHLIEDFVYEEYMKNISLSDSQFLIFYSSNKEDNKKYAQHVKHRKFSDHKLLNQNYELIHFEKNEHSEEINKEYFSNSDWYIYKKLKNEQ